MGSVNTQYNTRIITIIESRICMTCGSLFGRTDALMICPKCYNNNTITISEYKQIRESQL